MRRMARRLLQAGPLAMCVVMSAGASGAQDLIPIGPGEPSGSRSSVLPPPSGSQNPVLPPPSGYRYAPGTEGRWGDKPERSPAVPGPRSGAVPPPATRDLQGVVYPGKGGDAASLIDTIADIGAGIGRCWRPPVSTEPESEPSFTLRFSLRRDGSVIATPRVVTRPAGKDREAAQRLVESGIAALRECAPLPLSQALGASIAGRPISLRFELQGRGQPL